MPRRPACRSPRCRSSSPRQAPASPAPTTRCLRRRASSAWISRSSSPSSSARAAKNVLGGATRSTHVAGYAICNDVSERSLQKGGPGEWIKAKSHDTFRTARALARHHRRDPRPASARSRARSQRRAHADRIDRDHDLQRGALVSYISKFMTLMPGDVITTGTPPGVGMARNPRVFLKPGDEISGDDLGPRRAAVQDRGGGLSASPFWRARPERVEMVHGAPALADAKQRRRLRSPR